MSRLLWTSVECGVIPGWTWYIYLIKRTAAYKTDGPLPTEEARRHSLSHLRDKPTDVDFHRCRNVQ
jgi:hypothetical protein